LLGDNPCKRYVHCSFKQNQTSEEKYRTLFANRAEGCAAGEPLPDDQGRHVDYWFWKSMTPFTRRLASPAASRAVRYRKSFAIVINGSSLQFQQQDFAQQLETIVVKHGIDPYGIQVEVTESAVMENVDETIKILNQLQAVCVKVALDNRGIGDCSLSSSSSLLLDKLKVDQSSVRRIASDPARRSITSAMIALGRALNLEIVAVGIESEEALGYRRSDGCEHV
jgi:EAL domain-containing protein (putative c-di-GMP-specific phosphodiesterase class I)